MNKALVALFVLTLSGVRGQGQGGGGQGQGESSPLHFFFLRFIYLFASFLIADFVLFFLILSLTEGKWLILQLSHEKSIYGYIDYM